MKFKSTHDFYSLSVLLLTLSFVVATNVPMTSSLIFQTKKNCCGKSSTGACNKSQHHDSKKNCPKEACPPVVSCQVCCIYESVESISLSPGKQIQHQIFSAPESGYNPEILRIIWHPPNAVIPNA